MLQTAVKLYALDYPGKHTQFMTGTHTTGYTPKISYQLTSAVCGCILSALFHRPLQCFGSA